MGSGPEETSSRPLSCPNEISWGQPSGEDGIPVRTRLRAERPEPKTSRPQMSGGRSKVGPGPTRSPTPPLNGERAAHSILDPCTAGADPAAGSGRALPRRTWYTAYGCCLPALTGFTAPSRAGPDHQHCSPGAARSSTSRRRSISPAYRGFPVQGTPSPPPSAARPEDSRDPRTAHPRGTCGLPSQHERAETKGFEPLDPLRGHTLSRRAG